MTEHSYSKAQILKAHTEYWKASSKISELRAKIYPARVKVRSLISNTEATVIEGSLYPDQVNTTKGHMGWLHLIKLTNQRQKP